MNLRPSGYEPDELPGCSTPRHHVFRAVSARYLPWKRCRHGQCGATIVCRTRFQAMSKGIARDCCCLHAILAERIGGIDAPGQGPVLAKDVSDEKMEACAHRSYRRPVMDDALYRPGSDLLSRVLRRSTIGAGAFHGRVRNGIGCLKLRKNHQVGKKHHWKLVFFRHLRVATNDYWQMRTIKPIGQLVPVSFMHCCTSTPGLSTWSSTTALIGSTRFQVGFPLRCLQRLSRPHIATLQCGWRHNRSTRGVSIPVLSY